MDTVSTVRPWRTCTQRGVNGLSPALRRLLEYLFHGGDALDDLAQAALAQGHHAFFHGVF